MEGEDKIGLKSFMDDPKVFDIRQHKSTVTKNTSQLTSKAIKGPCERVENFNPWLKAFKYSGYEIN